MNAALIRFSNGSPSSVATATTSISKPLPQSPFSPSRPNCLPAFPPPSPHHEPHSTSASHSLYPLFHLLTQLRLLRNREHSLTALLSPHTLPRLLTQDLHHHQAATHTLLLPLSVRLLYNSRLRARPVFCFLGLEHFFISKFCVISRTLPTGIVENSCMCMTAVYFYTQSAEFMESVIIIGLLLPTFHLVMRTNIVNPKSDILLFGNTTVIKHDKFVLHHCRG